MNTNKVHAKLTGKELLLQIIRWILIVFFTVYALFPLFWLFMSSLKTNGEFLAGNPFSLPKTPQWQNYTNALTVAGLGRMIDRRILESTEKDTPCPKTKRKPMQDGRSSTITINSNPIPTEWVTHKLENNNIKEVLPLLCKGSEHCVKLPSLGTRQRDWESPGNLTLKASGI